MVSGTGCVDCGMGCLDCVMGCVLFELGTIWVVLIRVGQSNLGC